MCIQNRELIQMFNAPIHVKPEGGGGVEEGHGIKI